jgi:CAAX prenyl protease-like protein
MELSSFKATKAKYPEIPYIGPFAAFVILLSLRNFLPFGRWEYPFRVVVVVVVVWLCSRSLLSSLSWRTVHTWKSVAVGLLVFGIWIGPDLLWPSYRSSWLFNNALFRPETSIPTSLRIDPVFMVFRLFGTAILVPVVEELFWRGWLMRYLIDPDFKRIPIGTYSTMSLWTTAVLFASEHGSYWDVGLVAGLIYNWWLTRTRNLTDCILAHAVTNATLAGYVILCGQWQYWL